MTTYFVDPVGGNDSNNGQSFANRWKTMNGGSGASSVAAGDSIRHMLTPAKTDTGQTATFTNKSLTVTLSDGTITKLITNCDSVWTAASANVTPTVNTTRKEGTNCVFNTILAAFTTGKAAYFATGTLDLSAYQQISFWFRLGTTISGGVFRIDLCSDTSGNTPVNSFTINRTVNTGIWTAITIDNGSALGSSIQSIALFCISDPGIVAVLIDDVIACKAPGATNCLTLNSLIYAGSSGDPYPVKSINGTTLVLDADPSSAQGAGRGWSGVTGSPELYVRQPVATASVAASTTVTQGYAGATGSAGSHITISGGWDTTNMSSQTGDTVYDGSDGFGNFLQATNASRNFIDYSKISGVRYNIGCNLANSGDSVVCTDMDMLGCTNAFASAPTNTTLTRCRIISINGDAFVGGNDFNILSDCKALSNNGVGYKTTANRWGCGIDTFTSSNHSSGGVILATNFGYLRNLTCNDNVSNGVYISENATELAYNQTLENVVAKGNGLSGLRGQGFRCYGLTTSTNTTAGITFTQNTSSWVYSWGGTDSTPLTTLNAAGWYGTFLYSHREGASQNVNKIYGYGGIISSQTGVLNTGAVVSWKFALDSTKGVEMTSTFPLSCPVARIACKSGVAYNITFACYRDDVTNLAGRLKIVGGRYPGVGSTTSDITASITGSINTWTNITIGPFTSSEDCMVEILGEFWGVNSKNGYISGPITIA